VSYLTTRTSAYRTALGVIALGSGLPEITGHTRLAIECACAANEMAGQNLHRRWSGSSREVDGVIVEVDWGAGWAVALLR
jgi:hypothetical protein